jgi:hypothetical protein
MNKTDKKFYEKNVDIFNELDNIILEKRKSIRSIMTPPELMYYMGHSDKGEIVSEKDRLFKYDGIYLTENPYFPTNKIQVLWKEDKYLKFSVPCICGIFEDETHP